MKCFLRAFKKYLFYHFAFFFLEGGGGVGKKRMFKNLKDMLSSANNMRGREGGRGILAPIPLDESFCLCDSATLFASF